MLLTKNYNVVSSYGYDYERESIRDFTGWITNEGKYIRLFGESHEDVAGDYGFNSSDEAILNGWCRLSQTLYAETVYCELHYSRFPAIKMVLEKIFNRNVGEVDFLFYNNKGPTTREKKMQFIDEHLE